MIPRDIWHLPQTPRCAHIHRHGECLFCGWDGEGKEPAAPTDLTASDVAFYRSIGYVGPLEVRS